MAIIRSAWLWSDRVDPALQEIARPSPTVPLELPSPRGEKRVFTAPAGYRTIVRTISVTLASIPSSGNSWWAGWFHVGSEQMLFDWSMWQPHYPDVGDWEMGQGWSGMMVMDASFAVTIQHSANVPVFTNGWGHLLPLS